MTHDDAPALTQTGESEPKPKRERRPDYDRIRRFLKAGGVLQREVVETSATEAQTAVRLSYVVWRSAVRDGRYFHVGTCEWFKNQPTFWLDGSEGWLEEGPPGIFKRVPDIHPTIGESAHYVNPDGDQEGPA